MALSNNPTDPRPRRGQGRIPVMHQPLNLKPLPDLKDFGAQVGKEPTVTVLISQGKLADSLTNEEALAVLSGVGLGRSDMTVTLEWQACPGQGESNRFS